MSSLNALFGNLLDAYDRNESLAAARKAIVDEVERVTDLWWAERFATAHLSNHAGGEAFRELSRRTNEVLSRLDLLRFSAVFVTEFMEPRGMTDRIPFDRAQAAAGYLRNTLSPDCEEIEIAGSVRREEPFVKDIELVAVPLVEQVQTGLFGDVYDIADHLEQTIAKAIADGWLSARDVESHRKDGSVDVGKRMGERYKALAYMGIPVDLFIVRPPADFGVIFTIRTGPADFSERLVTEIQQFFLRVEGGRLLHVGRHVPCATEKDFFRAIGLEWIEPRDRRPERVRLQRPAVAT